MRIILQFILQSDRLYDQGTKYENGKISVHIFEREEIVIEDIVGKNQYLGHPSYKND
jgi:hypothetical protein